MPRNGVSEECQSVGTEVAGYPTCLAQVSTQALQLIVCRSETLYAQYRVVAFRIDHDLAGPAGNHFAASLAGVQLELEHVRDGTRRDVGVALKFPPTDAAQRRMVCEWFAFFPREVEIYSVSSV